jgi:Zn-finger nucleic acid-binding protein
MIGVCFPGQESKEDRPVLKCPRCDVATALQRFGEAEMDVCQRCGGMFFEQGELSRAATPTAGDIEYSTIDLDSFEHDDHFGLIICPRCRGDQQMKKVEFNIHTGIILDYCDGCRGFWLDGRELNRINDEVKRLNEAAQDMPDPPMLWFAKFIWSLPK